jgi:predicted SAM-dependent methyltransferase
MKLNLGCGDSKFAGYCNVDKYGEPDLRWDLERFPWPWADDSVEEVAMSHSLEHIGQSAETFIGVIKELYRVCRDQAKIVLRVPHPRHDNFLNDPTHLRAITPELSSSSPRERISNGASRAAPIRRWHSTTKSISSWSPSSTRSTSLISPTSNPASSRPPNSTG